MNIIHNLFFLRLFFGSKIFPGFVPKKDDLVIDIGSGDKPFWRADVYLDNLTVGNEHRFSATPVVKDLGLFVNCDITRMPFKNKAFDYSYCSHVLEHVERPDLAIEEIVRISKRGFVEIPDGLIEMMSPYQSHLWFVFLINNALVFLRKSKKTHAVLANNGGKYSYLARLTKDPFIRLYWRNNIKFKVINELKKKDQFFPTYDGRYTQAYFLKEFYLTLVRIMRFIFYKDKQNTKMFLRKNI